MFTPPAEVEAICAAFAPLFTRPSWRRVQAWLCGTLLAPANHALTAALRALGLAGDARFQNYHRLLNRARWSARKAAGVLLKLLVAAFVPDGALVLGLDETVERRRGFKIKARAICRDAARSSRECFQKTSGLRWLCLHLLVPVRWARRVWALPFLTALCPSARYAPCMSRGRRHKPLVERARGLIGQAVRWLPGRVLTVVADSGYAAIELLAWCQRLPAPITLLTRLRLDAALYCPAPARADRQKGRPRRKGKRLPTLAKRLTEADTAWSRVRVRWYGGTWRWLEAAADTAVWYHSGLPPVALRWVLVRDPKGKVRAAGTALDQPGLASHADRQRVRASVVYGSHLPGSPRAPGRRGPAPVERLGYRPHHPVASGALLTRGVAGPKPARLAGFRAAGRVVPKGVAHLLGCTRSGASLPLATDGFLHVGR